jgi:hypothetical protein
MKTKWIMFAVILAALTGAGAFDARAAVEVGVGVDIRAEADFYAPLGGEGAWVDVGSYGRCWRPSRVDIAWQPYSDGYWVWTDNGWYWVSDEPWAWACYHYGSWVYSPGYAWVWVPGIEWAPAWVSWRTGGGYVGWAPLPPRRAFGLVTVDIAPERFVFVQSGQFHERVTPKTLVVNNKTIVRNTTVINNKGPELALMQKETHQKMRTMEMHEAIRKTPAPASVTRSDRPENKRDARPEAKPDVRRDAEPRGAPPASHPDVDKRAPERDSGRIIVPGGQRPPDEPPPQSHGGKGEDHREKGKGHEPR